MYFTFFLLKWLGIVTSNWNFIFRVTDLLRRLKIIKEVEIFFVRQPVQTKMNPGKANP